MARGKPSASGGSVARTTRSAASKNAQPARSPSPVPAKVASGRKRGRRGGAAPEKADGGEHVDEQAEREAAKPGDRITRAQTSHDIVEPPQEEHLSGDEDEGPGSPPAGSLPMVKPEPAYYQGALGAKRVKREHFVKCEPGPVGETGMEAGTEEGTEEGDDPMTDAKFEVHTKPPYDEKQEERRPACQLGVVVPPPPTSTLGPAAAPGPAALADLETDNTLTEVATTVAAAVAAATATAATTTTTAATVPKPAAAARKGRRPQKQQAAAATAAAAHSVSVAGTQALAPVAGEAAPVVGAVVVSAAVPPPASVVAVASGSAAGTVVTTGRVLRVRHSARLAGVEGLTASSPARATAVAAGVTVAAAPVAGVAEAASDGTNGSLRSLAQEAINLRPTAGKLTAKQSKVCADFADAAYVKARKANVVARVALEKAKSSSGKPAPAAPAAAEGAVARGLREAMTKAFYYSCAPSPGQGKRLLQRQGVGALGAAGAVAAGAMQQQLLQVVDATAAMQAVHAAVQAGAAAAASAAVGQAACLQPTLPGVLQLLGAPPMYEPLRPGYGAGAGGFMQQAPAGGCPYAAAAATAAAAAAAAAGQLATGVQGMSLAAAGGPQQMQQAMQQMQAASLFQAQQLQQAQCMWMQPDAPATAALVGAGVASAVGALVPPPHWGNQLASVPSQHHLQQQQEHQQYYHHQYHQQHNHQQQHHLLPAACAAASAAAGPCWSSGPPLAPPSFPTPYPPLAGASSGAGSSTQYVQQPQPQQQLQQSQQHMLEAPAPLAYQLPPPQHQHRLPAPPCYAAGALAALSVPAPATGAAPLADAAAPTPSQHWEPGTSTQAAALLAAAGGAKADDLIEDIGGIRNAAEMEHPFQVPPWSGGVYSGAGGPGAAAADLVTAASAAAGAAGIAAREGGHAQTLSAAPRSPSPSYAYHVFRQDLDCGGDAEAVDDLEDDLGDLMASDSPPLPLDLADLPWLLPPPPLSQQHQQHEVQHLQHSQHPPPLHQALALAPPAGVASQE